MILDKLLITVALSIFALVLLSISEFTAFFFFIGIIVAINIKRV